MTRDTFGHGKRWVGWFLGNFLEGVGMGDLASGFHVMVGGEVRGPFSRDQLLKAAKAGKLTAQSRVSLDKKNWIELGSVEGVVFGAPLTAKPASAKPASAKPAMKKLPKRAMPVSALLWVAGAVVAVAASGIVTVFAINNYQMLGVALDSAETEVALAEDVAVGKATVSKEPITEDPVAEEPAVEAPAVEEPVVESEPVVVVETTEEQPHRAELSRWIKWVDAARERGVHAEVKLVREFEEKMFDLDDRKWPTLAAMHAVRSGVATFEQFAMAREFGKYDKELRDALAKYEAFEGQVAQQEVEREAKEEAENLKRALFYLDPGERFLAEAAIAAVKSGTATEMQVLRADEFARFDKELNRVLRDIKAAELQREAQIHDSAFLRRQIRRKTEAQSIGDQVTVELIEELEDEVHALTPGRKELELNAINATLIDDASNKQVEIARKYARFDKELEAAIERIELR